MLRCVYWVVVFSLIATQNVAKAEDHADLRASLQGCLEGALTAGDFGKARMGTRGMLVVHCSDQAAQRMYITLASKVPEQNMTLRNRDKGAERRFGLSTCYTVKERADGSPAAEFYCRISISVGAPLLESF
jgi:hypothetical protein